MQFGHSKDWRRRGSYQSGQDEWSQRSYRPRETWPRESYDRRDWDRDHRYYRSGQHSQSQQYSRSSNYRYRERYYHESEGAAGRSSASSWTTEWTSPVKISDTETAESYLNYPSRENVDQSSLISDHKPASDVGSSPTKRGDSASAYSTEVVEECDLSVPSNDSLVSPLGIWGPGQDVTQRGSSEFSSPPVAQPNLELIKSIPSSVIRDPRLFSRLLKIVKPSEATASSTQVMQSSTETVSLSNLSAPAMQLSGTSVLTSLTPSETSSGILLTPKTEPTEIPIEKNQGEDISDDVSAMEVVISKPAIVEQSEIERPPILNAEEIKKEMVVSPSTLSQQREPETPPVLTENASVSTSPPVVRVEKVPSPVPMPQLKIQSIVKESFLKLKQEGRAKMSTPSKGDSKQSQAFLKLVIDSEVASSISAQKSNSEAQRPLNMHNAAKFAGLKTILNSVMKTSISQVLRTKLDSRSDANAGSTESLKPLGSGGIVPLERRSSQNIVTVKSNNLERSKESKLAEVEEGTSSSTRARKSFPPVKEPVAVSAAPTVLSSNTKMLQKALVKSIKKQRKKFFKGSTYSLYLTKKKKKKHHQARDDESSITGTETTGSLVDSEDEVGSFVSEGCRSVSDASLREEMAAKVRSEDAANQVADKSDEETEKGSVTLENAEAKDGEEENGESKLDPIGDTKEDAAVLPTEEPAVPESTFRSLEAGIVTRRQMMEAVRNILNKENLSEKEGAQSIASNVKQRQRLKRRYMEDEVDVDIASSEGTGPITKRPRRAAMTFGSEDVQLSEITNGFVPNLEIVYHPKLPAVLKCCCQEKALDASSEDLSDDAKIYCQAVDSIGNRLIGCCNTVTTKKLVRPSTRIPFTAMCEVHLWRLRYHQCCPTCSVFCSEGRFLRCRSTIKDRVHIHLFHKNCMVVRENGVIRCPHCGSTENIKEIALELNLPSPPTFYLSQKTVAIEPKARMTFCKQPTVPEVDETPAVTVTTLDSGKILSSAGLPSGPCREELESLLEKLKNGKLDREQFSDGNLYQAAKSGAVDTTLKMLVLEFDPNVKLDDNGKEMPLHVAAAGGHLAIAHLLVQAGASLDLVDEHLYTPLMHAVEKKSTAIVQYLIKAGAQLDAKGEDGMCGLHLAARGGNVDICRAFLDTGRVDVNVQDDGGWTPIVWAAEHRHLKIVRLLIERGADPNIRDNELNNALHWSAYSGNVEISQLFLDLGLKLTDVNEHGDTPLHIASRQNNYDCVVLFLARGAVIDAKNKENQMPIKCCPDPESETYIALTMNYELKRIAANRPLQAEKVIYRDISRGKELNPIQCVNGVDSESFPTDFLYVTENCETSPISIDRTITSLQSCRCEDDCTSSSCTCATISFKCWYDNDGRLLPEFNLPDPPMIFECNRACLCWKNCNNRALQHGMISRLQLFKTKGKGWGVRTLKDIPRGTFVCEYIGEIISDNEADQREDDSYLFDLDNRDGETFCLDARYYGNISRFINHLCEPNLVPVKIFVDHQDLSFPRIAFFSSRDIKADEELGFDYGEKFWVIKYKWFTCTCGSTKCKYSEVTIHETLENFRRAKDEHVEEDVVVQNGTW